MSTKVWLELMFNFICSRTKRANDDLGSVRCWLPRFLKVLLGQVSSWGGEKVLKLSNGKIT